MMTTPPFGFDPPIIGTSALAAGLRDLALTLSASDVRVLITGESGVGKEVFARNLHRFSRRRERSFVSINCAALSPGILESELFGHSRGAFTGAVRAHAGLFEQANSGTLFLDEIGEIPPFIQAKLLRALQEKEVRRMGEGGVRAVDVRVISATNADVTRMVAEGTFRKDLFYRINVIEAEIRPLRERTEDIADLVAHFYRRRGAAMPTLTDETHGLLCRYSWPGNIRELENELERLIALYDGPVSITPGMFSARVSEEVAGTRLDVKVLYDAPLSSAVSCLERNLLEKALIQTNWNKSQTARQLGLSRQGLLKKIKRHGIRPASPGNPLEDTAT
jgi:transcriptional regulator with PAS, ATPase and Fis domain